NNLYVTLSSEGTKVWGIANNTGRSVYLSQMTSIVINGGSAADKVSIDPRIKIPATITTGAGDDTITSGAGDDYIDAGAGNNVVDGGAGNNNIVGSTLAP